MDTITYFRQQRRDGGIHSGIEVDGYTGLNRFDPGPEGDDDPILVWFVVVEFRGESLPATPEEAQQWLLANASPIRGQLLNWADLFDAGIDAPSWPLRREDACEIGGETIRLELTCSVSRRSEGLSIADQFRDIAGRWSDLIQGLKAVEEVRL